MSSGAKAFFILAESVSIFKNKNGVLPKKSGRKDLISDIIKLTDTVKTLENKTERLSKRTIEIDKRVVRLGNPCRSHKIKTDTLPKIKNQARMPDFLPIFIQ